MPDNVSTVVQTSVLLALGIYWIAIAILSKRAAAADQQSAKARWGVWILPWALSISIGLAIGMAIAHASQRCGAGWHWPTVSPGAP